MELCDCMNKKLYTIFDMNKNSYVHVIKRQNTLVKYPHNTHIVSNISEIKDILYEAIFNEPTHNYKIVELSYMEKNSDIVTNTKLIRDIATKFNENQLSDFYNLKFLLQDANEYRFLVFVKVSGNTYRYTFAKLNLGDNAYWLFDIDKSNNIYGTFTNDIVDLSVHKLLSDGQILYVYDKDEFRWL